MSPAFRRLFAAQLLSQGGDWFAIVPLLTLLLALTGQPLWGAAVLAVDTVVIAVLSPWAGIVVDRVDRRRLLMACDGVSAGCVLLLLLVRTEGTAVIALIAISGVAAGKALSIPTATAAVPALVPPDRVLDATVLSGGLWAVMLVVGSTASALLAAAAGPYWCFALDAASFVCSLILIRTVPQLTGRASATNRPRPSILVDLKATVALVRRSSRIAALLAAKPGSAVGNGILAVFPVLVATTFQAGPLGVGVLFSARGIGALLGPLLARHFLPRPSRVRPVLLAALLLFGVSYLAFPVVAWFPAAVLLVALAHAGSSAAASISTYGLQIVSTPAIRGRVLSADLMIQTAVIGASQLLVTTLAGAASVGLAVAATAAVSICYAIVWWYRSGSLRNLSPLIVRQD